ncbi:MAG: glycoside hydrolase family 3 C-terminal domain-containing protein [Pyrinomonadaceae bacterium]|nr:glycoside hydrolase family 3 C-terminal domain-containing protein [Pyrinomonadaceae bacterium]
MRKATLASATIVVMCLGLPPQKASTQVSLSSSQSASKTAIEDSGQVNLHGARLVMRDGITQAGATADRGPVTTDVNDSDEFFQRSLRSAKPSADHTQKIEALLKRMTLEEKVGQMTQLTISMVCSGADQNIRVDPAKLEKAMVQYGVGSILNVADQALSIDRWQDMIRQIQDAATKKSRLGIPFIYGIDSIHGANYVQGATLFPQEIGMAATWNPELMKRSAEISAMETRAAGIPWSFSPVLDLGRQPLWPRFWETFGEDPYLASVMGVAFVRGMEGSDVASQDHVATSLKHYVGYSFPLTGRDRTPAWIPENYLREYFLPPFAAAINAGARTVMVNSAEINGVPGHINHQILTDILRGELGFKGFVVSDWEDIKKLVTIWRIAPTEKEATKMAVLAGIDMSMVPSDYSFSDNLIALVKEGSVPQSRIDEAVRRILRVKFELGLFEKPMPDVALKSKFGLPESRRSSLQAARESMTLLKNTNNLLPLSKNQKVLVTGPTADSLVSLNNGWTYVWQGSETALYPKDRLTIRGAIEAKAGKSNVSYEPGTSIKMAAGPSNSTPTDVEAEVDIPAAVRAAQAADVVVLCLGEGSYTETPGNITDLTIGEPQLKLAEAIQATGKPIVLVLVEGRPRIINRLVDKSSAILMAYNPGNEGGQAVADVLFGDFNPSGKLPFTYPRTPNGLINYDHKAFETEDTAFGNKAFKPQFEFGEGLSYTTFTYRDLRLSQKTISGNEELSVVVTVSNTGKLAGQEVVQLYVSDLVASLAPPMKRLKRFAKVYLEPGQSRTLTFKLRRDDLTFINTNNKPIAEPGDFDVLVGGLKDRFTLR